MLGIFGWLLYGALNAGDKVKTYNEREKFRAEAQANNEPYYYDYSGKTYYTKTGERCYVYRDPSPRGNHTIYSCNTNKVLEVIDRHAEYIDTLNKTVKKMNKNYYYADYKNVDGLIFTPNERKYNNDLNQLHYYEIGNDKYPFEVSGRNAPYYKKYYRLFRDEMGLLRREYIAQPDGKIYISITKEEHEKLR